MVMPYFILQRSDEAIRQQNNFLHQSEKFFMCLLLSEDEYVEEMYEEELCKRRTLEEFYDVRRT